MTNNVKTGIGVLLLAGMVWVGLNVTPDRAGKTVPANEQMCFEDGTCGKPYPDPVMDKPEVNGNSEVAIVIEPVLGSEINPANVLSLINQARRDAGLPLVRYNKQLGEAAIGKANDMASRQYFAHANPEGNRMAFWMQQAGYQWQQAGEILAVGFSTVQGEQTAWMNSPTHKAVIVNGAYRDIGIGIAEGDYKGRYNVTYTAVIFGKR